MKRRPEARPAAPFEAPREPADRLATPGQVGARLDYGRVYPAAVEAMAGLERAVRSSALEPELLELVKMRASQLNGCGYCLDMHSKDAVAVGVEPQCLHLLAAWREAPCYSPRERAALSWCEALTLLPQTNAPDQEFQEVQAAFSAPELVALTLAVVAINGWNRLAVGFRTPVGSYTRGG